MGKYVKKGKITANVAVMEVPQSALGVLTRAKTLALQQNPDFCYLQLRSRRLEKPQFPPPSPPRKTEKLEKSKQGPKLSRRGGSRLRVESVNPAPAGSVSFSRSKKGDVEEKAGAFGLQASFGENNLELDGAGRSTRDVAYECRSTRESTPCSLIRDVGSIGTPGSAVRSTCSGAVNQRRVQDPLQRSIPSTREMEEFFANAGRQEQQQFMDKYNFDIFKDLSLPGRFEWVRVDP